MPDALGRTTTYARDIHGNPTQITMPDGNSVLMTYDAKGNLLQRTDQLGYKTKFSYELQFSRVSSVTDPSWSTTQFVYDPSGNLLSVTDPLNNKTLFAYNDRGLATSVTDSLGRATQYLYDASLRLAAVVDPMGFATSFARDGRGNITRVIDAKGNATLHEYDVLDRRTRVTDPSGAVTTFAYDAGTRCNCGGGSPSGNITSVTDPNGHATLFEYSPIGLLARTTDPMGSVKTFAYDMNRNLASAKDANGVTIGYEYDAANRVVRKTTPAGPTEFAYDLLGNLIQASNPEVAYAFTYDAANRNTSVESSYGKTLDYAYDYNGNRTFAGEYSRGLFIDYYYDTLNRLTRVGVKLSPSYPLVYSYATYLYDPVGQRTNATLGGSALSMGWTYDPLGRVTRMADGSLATSEYSYDELSRRAYETITTTAKPRLLLELDRTTVTAETLTVTGRVTGGAATVAVNGNPVSVDAGGNVSGTISLATGTTPLIVSVTDSKGAVSAKTVSVYRQSPTAGVSIVRVAAVAGNGDVYVIESIPEIGIVGGAVISVGSGTLTRPAWLTPAIDVAVDSVGRVYTLRGDGTLWVHDANGDMQAADLSGLAVSDMEVGPDDKV